MGGVSPSPRRACIERMRVEPLAGAPPPAPPTSKETAPTPVTRRLLVPRGPGAPGPCHVLLCTRGLAHIHPHPVKCQLPRSPRLPDAVTLLRPSCHPGDGRGGWRAGRGFGSARSHWAPQSLPLGYTRGSGPHAATWMVPGAAAHSLQSPELGQWGSGLSRTPGAPAGRGPRDRSRGCPSQCGVWSQRGRPLRSP